MLRLAREVPNIVAVKDAAGDAPATAHLVAQAPAGFEVYSGDDDMTLPLLSVGAVGVISVASHWIGPQFRAVVDAFWRATWPRRSPATPSCSTPSTSSRPRSSPTRCRPRRPAGPSDSGWASAGCPWARPPPSSTPRRPKILAGRRADAGWSRCRRLAERSQEPEAGPRRLPRRARARSAATAPASRSTAASSSSTAGSCSPTPTCRASTWCCPTSPTCATASRPG